MTHPSLENLKCPKCKGPMISRLNKRDSSRFWGCKSFPQCNGTRDVNGMSKEERIAEELKNNYDIFGEE